MKRTKSRSRGWASGSGSPARPSLERAGCNCATAHLRTLLKVAQDWFPYAASYPKSRFWIGARPMLPDGPPVLGKTPIANLYLNTGHGSTGWVMSCGSARVLADVIAQRTPRSISTV